MQQKSDPHIFSGMHRDIDISKHKPEFLYDAYNIRIKPREGDTLLGITNERGPLYKNSYSGKYVGHVVVDNDYIILFLTEANVIKYTVGNSIKYISTNRNAGSGETKLSNKDVIIRIKISDYTYNYLFIGNLNLDKDYQIQGIYRYESSHIKKIYWIDGKNQPRLINIEDTDTPIEDSDSISTRYDFIQTLKLNETVSVTKRIGGTFTPGVIQYAFSYFYLNGQESNIFYTTPLQYIGSPNSTSVSPEGKSNDAFEIVINNIETKFDYVRIYSIHRTSWNTTPQCKIVSDVKITGNTLTYVDYGNAGDSISHLELLYVGGQVITPDTMAFKDSTLFLGNYKMNLNILKRSDFQVPMIGESRPTNEDDGSIVPKFKAGEHYLLGIQTQDKYGRWSNPVPITDEPIVVSSLIGQLNKIDAIITHLPDTVVRVRGVCIYPTAEQRNILATGVINPTVYQTNTLGNNHKLFQSSWFFRPAHPYDIAGYQFQHNASIFRLGSDSTTDHSYDAAPHNLDIIEIEGGGTDDPNTNFFISYGLVDFYSPDAEFDYLSDSVNSNFRLDYLGDIVLDTESPFDTVNVHQLRLGAVSKMNNAVGPINSDIGITHRYFLSAEQGSNSNTIVNKYYYIYPWTSAGSFTKEKINSNDTVNTLTDLLESNKLLRWLHGNTTFVDRPISLSNCSYKSYLEENGDSSLEFNGNYYLGQVETLLQTANISKWCKMSNLEASWTSAFSEKRIVEMKYKTCSHLVLSLSNSLYFNTTGSPGTVNPPDIPDPGDPINERTSITVRGFLFNLKSDKDKYNTPEHMASSIKSEFASAYEEFAFPYTGQLNPNAMYMDDAQTPFTSFYIIGVIKDVGTWLFHLVPRYKVLNDNTKQLDTLRTSVNVIYGSDKLAKFVWSGDTNLIWGCYDVDGNWHGQPASWWDGSNSNGVYSAYDYVGSYILEDGELLKLGTQANSQLLTAATATTIQEPTIQVPEPIGSNTDTRLLIADLVNQNPVPLQDDVPWCPASSVPAEPDANGNFHVIFDIGDAWLQDYYCLKTYPFTREDDNSITEVLQFKCITRTNLNGRYSTMIVPPAIPEINRTNFSQVNKVYNNQNNFFNYSKIRETETVLDEVSNSMTWCQQNIPNSDTDSNVAISLANNYVFDNKITALVTNNLNFYAFHPTSVSKISFNPRVEISPSDNIPIELSTSKQVYGSDTILDDVGTSNKKGIISTEAGIYFVDDSRRELYLLGSNGSIANISDTKNFNSWFNEQTDLNKSRLFYDKVSNDLYLVGDDYCLVFNSAIQEFTSFMSYEGIPTMFNVGYDFYAFDWYWNRAGLDDNYTSLYHMFNGNYNEFFGLYKPVYLSFISNQDAYYDKIFTTVESRMDIYYGDNLQSNRNFDYIRVWNEYQDTLEKPILTKPFSPAGSATGNKKFRIWRVNIPRNNNSIDRIRNTWVNIKLGFNPPAQEHNTVSNLINTNNPNIAMYYNNIEGSNIDRSNTVERLLSQGINNTVSNSSSTYKTLKLLLHDINVKYFI